MTDTDPAVTQLELDRLTRSYIKDLRSARDTHSLTLAAGKLISMIDIKDLIESKAKSEEKHNGITYR